MRPVRLTMRAYGPYAGEQVVDFERLGAHGLFLIHGRTGSGKSTVLDAMCFALYGETSGDERKGKDAVSTYDPHGGTLVELEFEHVGRRYRIRRGPDQERPKKRGTGTTTQSHWAQLLDVTDGEKVVADKATAATAAITELLRCDAGQFRQTIVLPQGDFRKVVTDDGSRRAILTKVFGTGRFQRFIDDLKAKHNALMRDGQVNENKRQEILEALGAEDRAGMATLLVNAQKATADALTEKRRLDAAKLKAQAAMTEGTSLAADFDALITAREEAARLEVRAQEMKAEEATLEAARRAESLAGARSNLAERIGERDELAGLLADAEERASEAGGRLAAAEEAVRALEPERPNLEALAKEASRLMHLENAVRDAAQKRGELAEAQVAHRVAQDELQRARDDLATAEAEVKDAKSRITAASGAAGQLHEARERQRKAEDAVAAAEKLADLHGRLAGAETELKKVTKGEDPLAAALAEITLHAPSLLAAGLVGGDACPVCGSTEHPAMAHGEGREGVDAALRRLGAGAGEVADLRAKMSDLQDRIQDALVAQGWSDRPPEESELAKALAQTVADIGAAEDADKLVKSLQADVARLESEVESLGAAVGIRAEAERKAGDRVVELRTAADTAVKELPEDLRDPAAFAAALDDAVRARQALEERFTAAASELEAAKIAVKDSAKDVAQLTGRLKTAEEAVAARAAEFSEKLKAAGFSSVEELEAAALPEEDLARREHVLKTYREQRLAAATTVSDLERKLKDRERPDLDALRTALEEATGAAEQADTAWNEASGRASSIGEHLGRYDTLAKQDEALEQRKQAAKRLYELATGQVKGQSKMDLQTFVLRSIFGEVLTHGNAHLRHMTAGRYQLALKEPENASDTGLELNVHDSFSGGAVRSVRTLSGGEGFLASLALALGLAEVAQQQSGAIDHGALFIDEGFGSLDPTALDNAVGILRGLQESRRMVGIISHVDELKKRIPVQLLVEAGDNGSTLEVRVNA